MRWMPQPPAALGCRGARPAAGRVPARSATRRWSSAGAERRCTETIARVTMVSVRVGFAAALDQLRLEVAAHLGKDAVQVADGEVGQHVAAAFGDKDQMDMEHEYDMPACAILHHCAPWTKC